MSGPPDLEQELRALGRRGAASRSDEVAARDLPFGFGVGSVEPWRFAFRALENGELRVGPDDDPEEVATQVIDDGLGRASTFSAQLPGQISHVLCHPFVFAGLTECLLEQLAEDSFLDDPVPCLDPSLGRRLTALRREGLDEGATLLLEGPGASHGARADARLRPLVFTNVEPEMRLAGWRRPAPVLVLRRWVPE